MKLLVMRKDMKIKHSAFSPPTKYGETFFAKKYLPGGTNILWQSYGGCFTWGLMVISYKTGS